MMWPIEKRVLAYLDQHGPTHRTRVVGDLSGPDTNLGQGYHNGSNGGIPRIMGAWCRRLSKQGLIKQVRDASGHYVHHAITPAGRATLRESASAAKETDK